MTKLNQAYSTKSGTVAKSSPKQESISDGEKAKSNAMPDLMPLILPGPRESLDPTRRSPFGGRLKIGHKDGINPNSTPLVNVVVQILAAEDAINAKSAQMGDEGAPLGEMVPIGTGFVRHFLNADIYFSPNAGAHEVHGAIREKYNRLGGAAGVLGMPLTDESPTPDGGRYNHFQNGSIYWSGRTGAVLISGAIRNLWAAHGWEMGPLGYPVADEKRYATISPTKDPSTSWILFENGAIVTGTGGTSIARTAELSPEKLRCLVRLEFDRVLHAAGENLGLHAASETIHVSSDFPRAVTFGIHGFHENPVVRDTDFDIYVTLTFGLVWEQGSFTEPETKYLAANLISVETKADGLFPKTLRSGLENGIKGAFPGPRIIGQPLPAGGNTLPRTPDIIDVIVTAEGGLRVLLNPLPDFATGGIRAFMAQSSLDQMEC